MTASYNPDEVSIIVKGHTVSGYADGTFVGIAREADSTSDIAGADGQVLRSRSNDKRGNIVLTLLQSSLSNKFLTSLLSGYENKTAGFVKPFAVTVKNTSGQDLYSSNDAWILKPADAAWAKAGENREWTLRCGNLKMESNGA